MIDGNARTRYNTGIRIKRMRLSNEIGHYTGMNPDTIFAWAERENIGCVLLNDMYRTLQ